MVNWMIGKYAKLKFLTQSLDKLLKPFRREADGHCGLQMSYIQPKGMSYGSLDQKKVVCNNHGPDSRDKQDAF